MFANNTKVFNFIKSNQDSIKLQEDLVILCS